MVMIDCEGEGVRLQAAINQAKSIKILEHFFIRSLSLRNAC